MLHNLFDFKSYFLDVEFYFQTLKLQALGSKLDTFHSHHTWFSRIIETEWD